MTLLIPPLTPMTLLTLCPPCDPYDLPDSYPFHQVVSRDLQSPKGLAVDWATGNVYFSQSKDTHSRIEVVSSDGLKRKVLFSDLHEEAGALAINTITG